MSDPDPRIDHREQLVNDGHCGPIEHVALSEDCIVRVRGIMVDLDPGLLVPDNPLFAPADDPRKFLENIQPVLDRHPLARFAEVRASGRGLHLLIWLGPPVELRSAEDRDQWKTNVALVQATLPGDPGAPGITALTRPLGSTNRRNGAPVVQLRPGQTVTASMVTDFLDRVAAKPFRAIAVPLLGGERKSPCPVCHGPGTRLDVLDELGQCYGGCSSVRLDQLLDALYQPPEAKKAKRTKPSAPAKGRSGRKPGDQRKQPSQARAGQHQG